MGLFGRSAPDGASNRRIGCNPRIIIALVIAAISIFSYFRMRSVNPVTGEKQHISMTVDQEIALGLAATSQMAAQFGGLYQDQDARLRVEQIGERIVKRSDASRGKYQFAFHALADTQTVNAFALPGGQIFITAALLNRLKTDGQLAGVLAHEIGHVIARHSAEHIAKAQLTQGLTGAAVIATYDPNNPSTYNNAAFAMMIGQMVDMKYGRDDELEADRLGVKYMAQAGYDPRAMIQVMEILREAAGSSRGPDFFSTHPNPDRRIERIEQAIKEIYPDGVPDGLEK